MFSHTGFSLWLCAGEGALPGTELMVKKAELRGVYSQELTIGIAHALLGDQQDDRAHHQDKAEDVEDGGAHAAGGRQERAALFSTLAVTVRLASAVPPSTLTSTGSVS